MDKSLSYRLPLVFFLALSVVAWQAYRSSAENNEPANKRIGFMPFSGNLASSAIDNAFKPKQIASLDKPSQTPLDLGNLPGPSSSSKKPTATAIDAQWHKQTPAQLWQQWETRLNRSEYQQIPIIGSFLAESLHQHTDPGVYRKLARLLAQPDVPMENKAIALDLLSELATPESLTLLIDLAKQSNSSSPLFFFVLQAISRIGDNRWEGQFHEELSPLLEKAWADPEIDDKAFLNAIGQALSAIGAPGGVEILLATLSAANTAPATDPIERIKQEVAFEVIPQISNPNAVETLTPGLEQENRDTPVFEVTGAALAGMSNPKATEKLIDWAKQATGESTRNLESWLPKINDAESINLLESTNAENFQSPEIQNAIHAFVEPGGVINPAIDSSFTAFDAEK